MIKLSSVGISSLILVSLLFTGCGGAGDSGNSKKETADESKKSTLPAGVGKTDGDYNLWDYMIPKKATTNNFIETKGDKTTGYKTTYSVERNSVTEVSDYAKNEKTIYTKKRDRITVSFTKDNTPNGAYDLDLTADIGDIVTVLESTCKFIKHYPTKDINGKEFKDVIEIKCDEKPGYYQKNVGEIAQTKLSTNGSRSMRVLSN